MFAVSALTAKVLDATVTKLGFNTSGSTTLDCYFSSRLMFWFEGTII